MLEDVAVIILFVVIPVIGTYTLGRMLDECGYRF